MDTMGDDALGAPAVPLLKSPTVVNGPRRRWNRSAAQGGTTAQTYGYPVAEMTTQKIQWEKMPSDVFRVLCSYSGLDSLWALCLASSVFIRMLEANPGILMRLAASEGGYPWRVASGLLTLLRRSCIHTPSVQRVLRMLVCNKCEMCGENQVSQPRKGFGLMTCWPCQISSEVSVPFYKRGDEYKSIPQIYNGILDDPLSSGSRSFGWRKVSEGQASHERSRARQHGLRLMTRVSLDRNLDVRREWRIRDLLSYLQRGPLLDRITGEPIGCIVTADNIHRLAREAVRRMVSEGMSASVSTAMALRGLLSEVAVPSSTLGIPLRRDYSLWVLSEQASVSAGLADRAARERARERRRMYSRQAKVGQARKLVRRMAVAATKMGGVGIVIAEHLNDCVLNVDFLIRTKNVRRIAPLKFSNERIAVLVCEYIHRPSAFRSCVKVNALVSELVGAWSGSP